MGSQEQKTAVVTGENLIKLGLLKKEIIRLQSSLERQHAVPHQGCHPGHPLPDCV